MSDSMNGPGDLIVGTAGHIDHGKTALIRALTGVDTDRLAEEKKRGISIDLGFALLQLDRGRSVSFIDVPGHERFIRNMLAGAGGIRAVLLVVAANEGVKPQTEEHFTICRLLGIDSGLIVLSKADLANADRLAEVETQVRTMARGTFLADAPAIATSAHTGQGLDLLRAALTALVDRTTLPVVSELVRLPVDRSFAIRGFGTVVTGTLWSGRIQVGDALQLLPGGRVLRVRGLQVHNRAVNSVEAGHRVAVNLVGVEPPEIHRGDTLVTPATLVASTRLAVQLDWVSTDWIPKRTVEVQAHWGTAEVQAKLKVVERAAGRPQLALLTLRDGMVALSGDRIVLRRPSPSSTVAGASVLDNQWPRSLGRTQVAARWAALRDRSLVRYIQLLVAEGNGSATLSQLVPRLGRSHAELRAMIAGQPPLVLSANDRVVDKAWLVARQSEVIAWLDAFHRNNPSSAGAPLTALRAAVLPDVEADVADLVVRGMSGLVWKGDTVSRQEHRVRFSPGELQALTRLETFYRAAAFEPPALQEALSQSGLQTTQARALLELLIRSKRLIRVQGDLIFHADVILHLRQSLAAHRGRRFSVPEFKSWTNVSRKYAIPLLEFLDRERITRREGDARVVN